MQYWRSPLDRQEYGTRHLALALDHVRFKYCYWYPNEAGWLLPDGNLALGALGLMKSFGNVLLV